MNYLSSHHKVYSSNSLYCTVLYWTTTTRVAKVTLTVVRIWSVEVLYFKA